ncbi:MAG: nucleotidyltransferase domain-containing protein [Cloacibacillus porcorum]|uniref:nucleotidyltransferase domain-containing protein n=1 Tax=Cloacibacillus porcorum TaxID=1197717 RepID=UPI0023F3F5E4|nr:nucleotidyltransferase domain-containing protein [Cloacibacillus porcorum]MCD7875592.1 nucleotidyltransferase domain-containing protein [Cloacibacillus porcorum]
MTIDIEKWSSDLTERLRGVYGERLLFAGLQGSYGRGEAAPDSDIDIVVILKSLSVSALDSYRAVLDGMPHGELACGFISGERELLSWTPSVLFILYFDTVPLYGSLGPLSRLFDEGAAAGAVRDGACAIYHGGCHNYLYEKNADILVSLYKSAFFVLRAKYFCENGHYVKKRTELVSLLEGGDLAVLELWTSLQSDGLGSAEFRAASELLISWSSEVISKYS